VDKQNPTTMKNNVVLFCLCLLMLACGYANYIQVVPRLISTFSTLSHEDQTIWKIEMAVIVAFFLIGGDKLYRLIKQMPQQ
jgi:hypothetical protein